MNAEGFSVNIVMNDSACFLSLCQWFMSGVSSNTHSKHSPLQTRWSNAFLDWSFILTATGPVSGHSLLTKRTSMKGMKDWRLAFLLLLMTMITWLWSDLNRCCPHRSRETFHQCNHICRIRRHVETFKVIRTLFMITLVKSLSIWGVSLRCTLTSSH